MRPLLFTATALYFLFQVTSSATAEQSQYGSITHHENLPNVLFLLGEVKAGDSFELRRAMRDYEIELLVAASPGGNLYEGLQIASILHDKGLSTYIPEGASCESSCANIFLGGVHRLALGEIGVHQFYSGGQDSASSVRKDVATSATQYTTSEIIGIMNEFDTPPFVYEKMFGTDEIHYFRGVDKQKLGRGTDNEPFMNLLAEVDSFVASEPGALQRPKAEPEQTLIATTKPAQEEPRTQPHRISEENYPNTDFFGMDIHAKGLRNISLSQCEDYCKNDPECAAYSYVKKTRWCWPKSGVENISVAKGVVSGVTDYTRINRAAFERPFMEATALDILGYDIYPRGLKNMSLEQCRHACLATNGCSAFSWIADKSWCFPKHGLGELIDSRGIISGIRN